MKTLPLKNFNRPQLQRLYVMTYCFCQKYDEDYNIKPNEQSLNASLSREQWGMVFDIQEEIKTRRGGEQWLEILGGMNYKMQ